MQEWVINELNGINWGDKRLDASCRHLLDGLASAPDKSIPSTLESWSSLKNNGQVYWDLLDLSANLE